MKSILIGLVLFTVPLFILYQLIVQNIGVSLLMTVIMIVAGFVFTSVSAYMAGLVGSSNNPVSGITICTILFASLLLLLLMGKGAALGPVAAIMIGSVVCCAACIGGDNLQDLKCGYLVGATPWRQQVMLAIGAFSCALVMAPVLNLLLKAYGIGVPSATHPNPLIAPQATLMASVAKGMFGGQLPWGMISIGAVIGVAIILVDQYLQAAENLFAAGDIAYERGTAAELAGCYHPTWGRFRTRTQPVPGNHDYGTPGAAPYFAYFGSRAGSPSQGWYAYDVGSWRVYSLNSNCTAVGCGTGSPQEQWLRADLAANPRACVAARQLPQPRSRPATLEAQVRLVDDA